MWTSAAPANTGQANFLEFTEQRLKWQVRRVLPRDALMIEPAALFIPTDASTTILRLSRFDASISFAMGRLADTHQIVVVSDSYPLFEPLRRINERWEQERGKCFVAFFGHSMENRWGVAFKDQHAPEFINLDDSEAELFGIEKKEVTKPLEKSSTQYY